MCEEKRVSNVLYTMCNMSLESNATSRLAHMTQPRSQGAKHSIFLLTMKSIGIFRDFYDRFCSNTHSVSHSSGVFT